MRCLTKFVVLMILSMSVAAEQADRKQPVQLEADQVVIDDVKQVSTFSGNVRLSQGSMLMTAEKIIVHQDQRGFKQGALYGEPASFRQKREGLDEYVEGYAQHIEYDAREQVIVFSGNAMLKRNLDEVKGDFIRYNARSEVFEVGVKAGSTAGGGRVRAVLYPMEQGEGQ